MRRILAAIIIFGFILLCLYAFVEPVRVYLQTILGPTVNQFLGGAVSFITTSYVWQNWIIPWPNQLVIGMLLMIPIALFVHNSFNRIRTIFVRSAIKETGAMTMTEPVSTVSLPQPQPTTTEEKKPESSTVTSEEA